MKNCLLSKTNLWKFSKLWSRSIQAEQDRQNKVKTIEEIEKMEREFSETLNQVQRYLNNTFSEMFHGEQSPKIEPTARQSGEGSKKLD